MAYLLQKQNPIAVFDSGVGGISVLRELVKIMPQEDYITFRLEVFYGERSYNVLERITDLALRDFEKEKEVKQNTKKQV